jgi:hypothetical protein
MINFIINKINNQKNKGYIFFFLFILILVLLNLFFIKYWIIKSPYQIDANGNILLNKLQFWNGEPFEKLLNNKDPLNTFADIEFKISRMPLLIYFLYYFQIYISKNFIIIHLFKNIILSSLIFVLIKNYDKKLNNLFLLTCLLLIYSVPHNIVNILAIEPEESILIYFIITLFFLLTGEYKYRNFYITAILCLIFFTKASMFYLCFGVSLIYFIYEKKKQNILPVIFIIFCSIFWGLNSYNKTGKFAFGTSALSLNALASSTAYHKDFTSKYPLMSPDIYWNNILEEIKNKNIKNEWDAYKYTRDKSIKYIMENPTDFLYGVTKKLYVIFLSPFKDVRTEDQLIQENYKNPIRYSNFINKPFFIISIFILFYSIYNFKKINLKIKKITIYYVAILIFYFFPYILVFVYPRHCVPMYIIGFIYILLFSIYSDNSNKIKKLFEV